MPIILRFDRPGHDDPTVSRLRRELAGAGVDVSQLSDEDLRAASAEAVRVVQILGPMLVRTAELVLRMIRAMRDQKPEAARLS